MPPCDDLVVAPVSLHLSGDPQADELLSNDPLALLIGMVLDQQVRLELAFSAPAMLKERLGGTLDPGAIAAMDPDDLAKVFSAKPALHRYPGSMAKRVHELCRVVTEEYGGDASAVWRQHESGAELLKAVKALPGFGDNKARIFVALLGKQLGVQPPGWEAVSVPYSDPGSHRSVADITDPATLDEVRDFKRTLKAQSKPAGDEPPAADGGRTRARGRTH
jgi:uncharacterized HhH-GPD family protein